MGCSRNIVLCISIHACIVVLVTVGLTFSVAAKAAPTARQQQQNKLQQQREKSRQQHFNSMQLPRPKAGGNNLREPERPSVGRCFYINKISVVTLNDMPLPFDDFLPQWINHQQGSCYDLSAIKVLQKQLFNIISGHGYITARVLLPQQDINDGSLKFLLVPGQLGDLKSSGMPTSLLLYALPADSGDLLNLRDLEQAVENLSRLPNMDVHMALSPGESQGLSDLTANANWPHHVSAGVVLSNSYYSHHSHDDGQIYVNIGSLFGLLDKLSLNFNTNLNKQISDKAHGGSLNYQLAWGYWLFSAGFTQQTYRNEVNGILQQFIASGDTKNSRIALSRVFQRSQTTRLSLSIYGAYKDVGNLLDETVIRVSSYWLRKFGVGLKIKSTQSSYRWQGSLKVERGHAGGAAVASNVAPENFRIWHIYGQVTHPLRRWPVMLTASLSGQYTPDKLLSGENYSLTSSSVVPGFDDDFAAGSTAGSTSLKLSRRLADVALSPSFFGAFNMGFAKTKNNVPAVHLSSLSLGAGMGYKQANVKLEVAMPLNGVSSFNASSDYTIYGTLYWRY